MKSTHKNARQQPCHTQGWEARRRKVDPITTAGVRVTAYSKDAYQRAVFAADLSSADKAILLAMSMYADWETGRDCYPSTQRLAADAGCSPRTVQRRRPELAQMGWFHFVERSHAAHMCTLTVPEYYPVNEREGRHHVTPTPDTMSPQGRHHVTPGVTPCREGGDTMSPNLYQGPLQEEEEVEVVRAHTHEAPVDDEPPATSTQDQSIREEVEHDGERLHGWVMNQLSAYLEQTGGRGHVMGEADRLATRILREGWPLRASAELIMEKRRECALRDDVPDLHRLTTWTLRDLETKFLGEVEDRRARRREFERCEEMMVHHEEWLRDQERDHSEYAALARKIFGVDPGPDSLRAQRGKPVPELEELRDLSDRFLEVPDFGDRVEDDDADTFDEELAP